MEPPRFSGPGGGGRPPRRPPNKKEHDLQGPRPSPLRVSKDSHKIAKHPHPQHLQIPLPYVVGSVPQQPEQRQPVIIYSVSPKVIHAEESNFMSIVQRLTGLPPAPGPGDVSPAARMASIERTSPTERGGVPSGVTSWDNDSDIMDILEGVELAQIPGILSPAPATLPPVPPGFFSPAMEPQNMPFLQDLSPFWNGNFSSPSSALFQAPIIFSPSPSSSMDLFNLFVQSFS